MARWKLPVGYKYGHKYKELTYAFQHSGSLDCLLLEAAVEPRADGLLYCTYIQEPRADGLFYLYLYLYTRREPTVSSTYTFTYIQEPRAEDLRVPMVYVALVHKYK